MMGVSAAIAVGALAVGTTAYSMNNMPKPTIPPITPENRPAIQDPQAIEANAEEAKKKRRRSYANMGRRSTILTGPGGFDFNDAAERLYGETQGKQLLGH
jgi:hypothetical protein